MKKTVYDFSLAIEHIREWNRPSELSYELKDAALALATIKNDEGDLVKKMQCAVLSACWFLDCIIEKEVEQ